MKSDDDTTDSRHHSANREIAKISNNFWRNHGRRLTSKLSGKGTLAWLLQLQKA
jgi:hypothetical protein